MYLCEDGKTREIPSERIARYRQNLQDIYRRKEWKTTGTGAQFTQTMANRLMYQHGAEQFAIEALNDRTESDGEL